MASGSLYDPKKAHEYYMKNRKLKGRHPTKGMSQQQKEQFSYAKATINANARTAKAGVDKKTKLSVQQRQKEINTYREKVKEQRAQFTKDAQSKISSIRESLKNMPPAQRKIFKEKLTADIAKIKSDKKINDSKLTAQSKAATTKKIADTTKLRSNAKASKETIAKNASKSIDTAYKKIKGR
ncbi:hypothetical protein [Lactococcus garvieae]|uniref:hypothetical protein n=1 Tax=Lactococcus garvieae TaxID=1363 RepID=UPI003853A188